jgi:negative regulator of genetic competence, sporulation and motility
LSTIKKKDGVRVPFTSANHEWKQNPKSLNLEKKKKITPFLKFQKILRFRELSDILTLSKIFCIGNLFSQLY